jgi:hypothetical protein
MNQKDILDDFSVQTTFAPCLWLEYLIEAPLFNDVRGFANSFSENEEKLNVFRGFKLLLISSLYEFIDSVIRSPETLDIPFDEGLKDAWAFSGNRGRDTLSRFVRRNSPVSCVFNRISSFWNELLRANSWEDLESTRIVLFVWVQQIKHGFRYSHICQNNKRKLSIKPDKVLVSKALDYLWPQMAHIGKISGIYSDVYLKYANFTIDDPMPEDWKMSTPLPQTRLNTQDEPFFTKRPPKSWAQGYAFALSKLIQKLNETNSSEVLELSIKLNKVSSWNAIYDISRDLPLDFIASKKTRIVKIRSFPKSSLRSIMLSVKHKFTAKQLLGIMGNPLKIVESDSLSAPFNFSTLLNGSVTKAKEFKQKVRIIRLLHKEPHDSNSYSIAVFMPMYTWISNWSSWWLFFDLYSDYSKFEDHESVVYRDTVEKLLNDFKDDIEVETYPISKDELLTIAEDPGFMYLKDELMSAKNINWNIRGVLPELVCAAYYSALDFHPVIIGMKPRFLDGKELDIVSVNWDEGNPLTFNIIECKGSSVSNDKELQQQIDKFAEKIKIIRQNKKQLAENLNIVGIPQKVNATFISLADIDGLDLKKPRSIDIWSFDTLINKLKEAQIPTWHLELLRKSSVALTITFGESFHKVLFDQKPKPN